MPRPPARPKKHRLPESDEDEEHVQKMRVPAHQKRQQVLRQSDEELEERTPPIRKKKPLPSSEEIDNDNEILSPHLTESSKRRISSGAKHQAPHESDEELEERPRSIRKNRAAPSEREDIDNEDELLPPHLSESSKRRASSGGKHPARNVQIEYQEIRVRK